MLGNVIGPEIEDMIRERRWDELREAIGHLDPADIADLVIDLPPEPEAVVFRVLPRQLATSVFSHLPIERQEELVQSLSSEHMRGILELMTPDDRTRLFEELPAGVTRRLLETLPPTELKAARELLGYPPETAGRYMTPRFVAMRPDMTAAEALDYIRRTGQGKETLNTLYIVDNKGRLIEDLRLGSLVLAPPDMKVVDIQDRALVSVNAMMDREQVVREFEKYDRFALPVTDNEGNMLGIITSDDVLDVAAAEATEDMQKVGGAAALGEPYLDADFGTVVRTRAGWLSVLFLGEMLTTFAMAGFGDEVLAKYGVVLAIFIPLIISSGGNSGSQATTLIIRSLALEEVRLRDWARVLRRELATGATLGGWLGFIGFLRVFLAHRLNITSEFTNENYVGVSVTVWISVMGVVMLGTVAGSMLPLLLRRVGLDPATSSAPFVATLVDVTGLIIYFGVAAALLSGALW